MHENLSIKHNNSCFGIENAEFNKKYIKNISKIGNNLNIFASLSFL
jgi:hypothetical protein